MAVDAIAGAAYLSGGLLLMEGVARAARKRWRSR